jgi:hypothetical protein
MLVGYHAGLIRRLARLYPPHFVNRRSPVQTRASAQKTKEAECPDEAVDLGSRAGHWPYL